MPASIVDLLPTSKNAIIQIFNGSTTGDGNLVTNSQLAQINRDDVPQWAVEQSADFSAGGNFIYPVDARVSNINVTLLDSSEGNIIGIYDKYRSCSATRTITVTGLLQNTASDTAVINTAGAWLWFEWQESEYGYKVIVGA